MKKLISWLFFLSLLIFFLLPATDPDLGWHLTCGQEFWQKQSLCQENQFSVLLQGYHWPNHYWLYQAILTLFYQLAGLWGLSFFNALLVGSALGFFFLAIKDYAWEKMIAIALTIFLCWSVLGFGVRSQLIGFFFFNLLLFLVTKIETNPRLVFCLPLLTLVWANSHGSVIMGLIFLLFWGLKEVIRRPRNLWFISLILCFTFLATLFNPFGFRIYQDAWRHFAVVKLNTLIAEWVPPAKMIWWFIFLSGLASFFFLLNDQKEVKIMSFLIPLFALPALKARRQITFFFLITFFLLLHSPLLRKKLRPWLKRKTIRRDLTFLTTFLFLLISLFIRLPQAIKTNQSWENYSQSLSFAPPVEAIEFLKNQPQKGNLFNRYEWGGWLIWQLPEYKIFVDGRMPAWPTPSGKSPYTIYLETLQTQPGWQKTLKGYNLNWLLISPNTFMDLKLRPNPAEYGWQEVFRDKISVVYRRI